MVRSIHDPLGLVSLFVLEGKQIIQMLYHSQFPWDNRSNLVGAQKELENALKRSIIKKSYLNTYGRSE